MTDITVKSGALVSIYPAAWKDAKKLKNAIEREAAMGSGLNINTVLMVDSSEAVDAALLLCLIRCTYNNEKITEQTFDKPEARADYYDIVSACIKENLAPLAEGLLSKLKEYGLVKKQAKPAEDQKSE